MHDADRQKLEAAVRAEVTGLKREIGRLEELVKPVAPDNAIGRLSRLDNMVNQEVAVRSLGQARKRLVRLEWMLEHMDGEDFGTCRECGEDIPLARMLAVPESGLCLECATDQEG